MGKKTAFTKSGGAKANPTTKNIFKVSDVQHKKKAKAVKTQIKKVIFSRANLTHIHLIKHTAHHRTIVPFQIQANVKVQQEKSDKKLKSLHEQMVVKKPAKTVAKVNNPKKEKKAAPNAKQVANNLEKMNVGWVDRFFE